MERKKAGMMDFVRVIIDRLRQNQHVPEHERRIHKRFELMKETDMVVLFTSGSHLQIGDVFPAYLRNISRSGVALLCQIQLNRDDLIGVRMKISGKSRCVWTRVRRIGQHSPSVSTKIVRMIDLGAEFYTDYRQHFADGLRSPDSQHRNRIHEILVQSGDPIAESLFAELVDTAGDEVRCEAILGLSKTGTADSAKLLLKLLGLNELLEIQPSDPMYATLAEADMLREQQQLPNVLQDVEKITVDGQSFDMIIQNQPKGKFTAICPDVPNARSTAHSRKVAMAQMRSLLKKILDRSNSSATVALRHVFIADLAAYALRNITGLDLPLDMTAPQDIRSEQKEDWIRETTLWQQTSQETEPNEEDGE